MAARFSRNAFSSLRSMNINAAARSTSRVVARRGMSSSSDAKGSSDTVWIIGSIVVFGGTTGYLLLPPAKATAKHQVAEHTKQEPVTYDKSATKKGPATEPMKDDEGTEASAEEIDKSLDAAYSANSPKDAQGAEEEGKETPAPAPSESEGEAKEEKDSEKSDDSDNKSDQYVSKEREDGSEGPQGGKDNVDEDKKPNPNMKEQPKGADRAEKMKSKP
ncbi:hypothetical protein SISSUDRAFT_268763 [Sistotremastrum suecicum HHB10207 ss-3]|uniref:Uncharacterized protein n=1 Tax=Sistotremastrum suecicum HHB10207 ss-3 TaxID=1314776 RepID=A0A165ZS54_9AGAM|nr:hypothetical protein SISSUDRAFT_268763 [Sistotremastrum suecicum HHB10207 ss-3]